jgi:thiamine-phosphate diphosphorylase
MSGLSEELAVTARTLGQDAPPRAVGAAIRERLRLHVLTDRALSRGRPDAEVAAAALAGGATIVQVRGKDCTGAELVRVGHQARDLTRRHGGLLIVNDRVDVALAVSADGAHVGQDDLPARDARLLLGPDRLLGVSARTVDEAVRAARDGADYIGFGPVFSTATKGDAGAARGLEELSRACRAVAVPIVAIGGITADNAVAVIAAGAAGVAVIAAVVTAPDMTAATRALLQAITGPHRADDADPRPQRTIPAGARGAPQE